MAIDRDADLAKAIKRRDINALVTLMFEGRPPQPRSGFKTEGDLWDFKAEAPTLGAGSVSAWAKIAKHVVGFHNASGGVIVFGINDNLRFTPIPQRLDSKLVNDRLRKYVGDLLWCEFHREYIQPDQRYLGLLIVPPRGPQLLRFRASAADDHGNELFAEGDSAIRQGDSTYLIPEKDVDSHARRLALPSLGRVHQIDDPYFRILAPDYAHFVPRPAIAQQLEAGLKDPRISVVSLLGIGGAGKTALATWAVLNEYDHDTFPFIVSVTAKDRELTPIGIAGVTPSMTSFESLLDNILDVLGFPDQRSAPLAEKEEGVRHILKKSNGLLFVDNLETVDDPRIIAFLDELPLGVRAIVTSRRTRVRVASRPVEVGPLTQAEATAFTRSLSSQPGLGYIDDLTSAEIQRIATACDAIPLAIRWALSRSRSAQEALLAAEGITKSGKRGEELLEFSFRRVFESLSREERRVLDTLALFQAPLPLETVLIGAGTTPGLVTDPKVLDAIDGLVEDALVQRIFDPQINDNALGLLPITRAFVNAEAAKSRRKLDDIRSRLTDYFEATDIKDTTTRVVVRELRQGRGNPETGLLDLAIGAENRGDYVTAQDLYEQALARNPRSWQVARRLAEFERHKNKNLTNALRHYEQAAANAPSRGHDRAIIFREWGMLLRDSGHVDATDRAIECFNTALAETPNDEIAVHALATMFVRTGGYRRAIELLEPMLASSKPKSREAAYKTLLQCYDAVGDRLKAVELRARVSSLNLPAQRS